MDNQWVMGQGGMKPASKVASDKALECHIRSMVDRAVSEGLEPVARADVWAVILNQNTVSKVTAPDIQCLGYQPQNFIEIL